MHHFPASVHWSIYADNLLAIHPYNYTTTPKMLHKHVTYVGDTCPIFHRDRDREREREREREGERDRDRVRETERATHSN